MIDPNGQAMYRALSQGANPYRDRKRPRVPGSPIDSQGQPIQPQYADTTATPATTTPVATPKTKLPETGGFMGGTDISANGGINPTIKPKVSVESATTAATTPPATPAPNPYDFLGSTARRQSGGSNLGSSIGSVAGGIGGSFIPGIGNFVGGTLGSLAGGLIGGAFNRQSPTAGSDFSVEDASKAIDMAYQSGYGRAATPDEITTILQGQGWKPGSRWVGEQGIASVLKSIEGNAAAEKAAREVVQPVVAAPMPTPAPTSQPATQATTPGTYNPSLKGFDANKFNDPTHQTTKYQFARIASKYPATQAGFAQLAADPELATLGFKADTKGNITAIDDRNSQYGVKAGETIDVMQGYQRGGEGWAWMPDSPGGAVGNPNAQGASANSNAWSPDLINGLLSDSIQGKINPSANDSYSKQLIAQLMQQLALGGALR
jgi:hypothetical protein